MSTEHEELPGMLALANAVQSQEWPHTADARVWATHWLVAIKNNPEIATDEGTMIGWFSNAIMAGYDTAMMKIAI